MSTSAKIIADSISAEGVRLTTMQVTCHRFVLAEFNTHRRFSRNSASSRAIPLSKQILRVLNDLALPVAWPREQKGMQGGEALDEQATAQAQSNWDKASKNAVEAAQAMGELGVHKSVVNRLLEPFMWHTIVVTSTAWENFFVQRCSPLAQPEIRVVAEMMRDAMATSTPRKITETNWHLPYVWDDEETIKAVSKRSDETYPLQGEKGSLENWQSAQAFSDGHYRMLASISAARCARVSYLTQDGRRDIDEDLRLYQGDADRTGLVTAQPPHWSPLEHVATPWPENRQETILLPFSRGGREYTVCPDELPAVGNLLGWRSLRTEVETEKGVVTWL